MTQLSKALFWNWFEKNQKELFDLPDYPEEEKGKLQKELKYRLREIEDLFDCMIVHESEQAIFTLTVSGEQELFEKVDDFIDRAPEIPGWIFKPLLLPGSLDDLIENLKKTTGIDPEEFRFSFYRPEGKKVDIMVFHPLYTSENDIDFFDLADRTLLNFLGERSYGNNIGEIDIANISASDPDKLQQLNVFKTIFNLGFVVDREGHLTGLTRSLE